VWAAGAPPPSGSRWWPPVPQAGPGRGSSALSAALNVQKIESAKKAPGRWGYWGRSVGENMKSGKISKKNVD
jgi:hypothetical protein